MDVLRKCVNGNYEKSTGNCQFVHENSDNKFNPPFLIKNVNCRFQIKSLLIMSQCNVLFQKWLYLRLLDDQRMTISLDFALLKIACM